jgi:molybdopterin molybdotransferase
VRIFTGAHVPLGADSIIMQEDVEREGETITLTKPFTPYKHIRPKGLDFKAGETLFKAGHLVKTPHLGLLAAMNYKELPVYRQPRVAILSTGDELVEAGEATQESQIVSTNALVLAQIARENGAIVQDYGICKDNADDLSHMIAKIRADKPDLLLTSGGASVGDYDLVQQTLGEAGMELSFWKIAMRPGKPLIHGQIGEMRILGLPGNPVSSFVCGHLFVIPLIKALQGGTDIEPRFYEGVLQSPLKANDERADFLRGHLKGENLEVFSMQDSSMLSVLAKANVLIFREAFDKPKEIGEKIKFIKI